MCRYGLGTSDSGSSPRARGTLRPTTPRAIPARFIPAGAGNTRSPRDFSPRFAVHPRGRGEHTGFWRIAAASCGSSPRARGTRSSCPVIRLAPWFIPAGAGNTSGAKSRLHAITVHPRGRGEHLWLGVPKMGVAGSSPRARGTRSETTAEFPHPRFIPAGAGNTPIAAGIIATPPVHPRGRGEHLDLKANLASPTGSSPRARGTRRRCRRRCRLRRFIPAGAGNTRGQCCRW